LSAAELKESMLDIAPIAGIFNDDDLTAQIMNDVSGKVTANDNGLNFFEWMFIRQCGVAWSIGAGRKLTITKEELLDIGMKVMPHFTSYEGQLKNVLFNAIAFQGFSMTFTFLDTVNVFHKYLIFESMRKHNSVTGSLNYIQLMRAIDDHVGPAELFTVAEQEQMFNLE